LRLLLKDVDSPAIWAWRFLKEEVRLRGSTGALLRTLPSGKRVVVKRGGREGNDPQAHIRNEYDMNRYLHELGVGVPHAEMVEEEDRPTMISDFEEGARPVRYSDAPALRQDFVPQALIANWDTLGQEMDNVLIRPDGTPTYVDVGGAGPYRARGAPKGDWGDVDTELASMQYYAPHTSQIYGDMTAQEMYDSYDRYGGLPAYLNAANVINDPQTKNILTQRAQDLARRID
jgi:hypothetical protein